MRRGFLAIGLSMAGIAHAQVPDLSVRLDLAGTFRYKDGTRTVRLYDAFGIPSTVTMRGTLELGYKFQFTQKLDRIPNDADQEWFQEAFLEDEGIWRLGKQFLPFGSGFYRETGMAARGDTNLLIEGFPITGALIDSGRGRASGAMVRLGDQFQISAAYGRHFGINATAFGLVEGPESSLGKGRGYKRVLGAAVTRPWAKGEVGIEAIQFALGETDKDHDREYLDLRYSWTGGGKSRWTAGFTFGEDLNQLRLTGQFAAHRNALIEPFVRIRKDRLFDAGFNLRLRL